VAIKYAILGLLSWRPASGYDLKKVFAESTALYWSGNSNQVYPALIRLQNDGLVTSELQHEAGYPAKKVYSITERGDEELTRWVLEPPDLPQTRDTFLTRLAWADRLDDAELEAMVERYIEELQMKLLMHQEWVRRRPDTPARTPREIFLWDMITRHDTAFYEGELRWVLAVREGLDEL